MNVKIGQKIHFDTDNEEWGRVASDGTIVDIFRYEVLVNAESIRANIVVPFKDIIVKG